MYAIRQEVLPASGVEFCASLNLTPSTLAHLPLPTDNDIEGVRDSNSSTSIRHAIASRALFNLVVARSNILRIFEVREHPAPVSAEVEAEGERSGKERKGTEAVEGEVEMDDGGEGYVNVGEIKVTAVPLLCYTLRMGTRNSLYHAVLPRASASTQF